MYGYYEIKELKYILEVDIKIVIESVVGIEILLDMIFIIL